MSEEGAAAGSEGSWLTSSKASSILSPDARAEQLQRTSKCNTRASAVESEPAADGAVEAQLSNIGAETVELTLEEEGLEVTGKRARKSPELFAIEKPPKPPRPKKIAAKARERV